MHLSALRWACAVVSVVLVLLAGPRPAAAQGGSDEEARGLFTAGEVAFREGRYEAALEYFQRAYALSGRALLLYNVGSAADRLRQDAVALAAFEQYLAETGEDAPNRAVVVTRVEFLRAQITSTAVETEAEDEVVGADVEVSAPQADSGPGATPWVLVGVGAGVAVAGAVLVGVGFGDAASVDGAAAGTPWTSVSGAYERAPILEGVGFALLGAGVALAVAGAAWGATAGGGTEAAVSTATVWVTPSGAGVVAMGSF